VEQSLGDIIKVIYFVPLVCHECSVRISLKTNRGGNYCVVRVRLTISPNMKCKTVGIKTLLDPIANISNGFAAELG
jgi:hypothetical protein